MSTEGNRRKQNGTRILDKMCKFLYKEEHGNKGYLAGEGMGKDKVFIFLDMRYDDIYIKVIVMTHKKN